MKKLIFITGLLSTFATTKTAEEPKSLVITQVKHLATFTNISLILGVAATRMVAEDLVFPILDRRFKPSQMTSKGKFAYECGKYGVVIIPIFYLVDRFHN